jgi:hypothetical protein
MHAVKYLAALGSAAAVVAQPPATQPPVPPTGASPPPAATSTQTPPQISPQVTPQAQSLSDRLLAAAQTNMPLRPTVGGDRGLSIARSPNMFGDFFGSFAFQSSTPNFITVTNTFTVVDTTVVTVPGVLNGAAAQIRAVSLIGEFPGNQLFFGSAADPMSSGTSPVTVFIPGGQAGPIGLQSNSFLQATPISPPPGTVLTLPPDGVTALNATLAVLQPQLVQHITAIEAANGGAVVPGSASVALSPAGTGTVVSQDPMGATTVDYDGTVSSTVNRTQTTTRTVTETSTIVDPVQPVTVRTLVGAAGGATTVGRYKTSELNSPLPRDRFIFNYNYFNDPIATGGLAVNRYTPGIEKTFLDGNASLQILMPFASTLGSDVSFDQAAGNFRNVELGDLALTLKLLLFRNENWAFATGATLSVPTADDGRIDLLPGVPFFRFQNQSYHLQPYLAALYTPTDRLFTQVWLQTDFDLNGNDVQANLDLTGLRSIGRYNDAALLFLDMQIGYWLYLSQQQDALLRGVAPFLELHYNSTMGTNDSIAAGQLNLVSTGGALDILNISFGSNFQFGTRSTVQAGLVMPLKGGFDKPFEYEIGVRAQYLFGRTAREAAENWNSAFYVNQ